MTKFRLNMVLRDIQLLVHSLVNANKINGHKFYWDDIENPDLNRLVNILSNPNDSERQCIRSILKEEDAYNILDVACGPATELTGYQEEGLELDYVGFDKSKYMLGVARKRFNGKPFVRGDVESLPFKNNSFQIVLLKHILEHVPSYEQTVGEAVRVSDQNVIINFFHRLLPINFDLNLYDKRGYWNNWYSRSKFESFLYTLPINDFERRFTKGTSNQTAEIYLLKK